MGCFTPFEPLRGYRLEGLGLIVFIDPTGVRIPLAVAVLR